MIEEQPTNVDGQEVPVDTTKANPNGEEFDNLYLDMNGIVHPCSHPEDRPPPANEEEMMMAVFEYTDRVVNMVRPRKLLMIAVGKSKPLDSEGCYAAGLLRIPALLVEGWNLLIRPSHGSMRTLIWTLANVLL